MKQMTAKRAILDGEIVAVDEHGVPRFQLLQHRSKVAAERIHYFAFDLLALNERDLKPLPLKDRQAALRKAVAGSGLQMSEPLDGKPDQLVEAARAMGLEGIVAKRRDSAYEPGRRTGAWQKFRLNRDQEFVVGGFSAGAPFDSILVGYYEGKDLMFCGRVRAGFTKRTRLLLFERLEPLVIAACPFANLPSRKSGGWNEGVSAEDMKLMTWVKPDVVVQIAFVEWTDYGLLRHATYQGMRADKSAKAVVRE